MKVSDIRKAAVVGAGTMGHGIAEQLAMLGLRVWVRDVSEDILRRAREQIEWSLGRLQRRGVVSDPKAVLGRLTFTTDLREALEGADLMVEAVPERVEIKHEVFRAADRHAAPNAVLATNTGSIPISEIAEAVSEARRPRVVGLHFFNPVVLMPIVEVVRGRHTSDETMAFAVELVRAMGKRPVVVNRDVPGFVSNRMSPRYIAAAVRLVEAGRATPLEVDSALRYRLGLPMGVFEMVDFSGLDVFYFYFEETSKRGMRQDIPETVRRMHAERRLGMKTGSGFYSYPAPGAYVRVTVPRDLAYRVDVLQVLAPMVNEAAYLIREGVTTAEDVDVIMRLGFGFPMGLLEYADIFGLDAIKAALEAMAREKDYYRPDPLLQEMVAAGKLGRKTGEGFYRYGKVTEERMSRVVVRREPPLGWVVFNRPEALNAMDEAMMEEVVKATEALARDPEVKVIVYTGTGRAFSSGADINMISKFDVQAAHQFSQREHAMIDLVDSCPKPTVCAINGYALGGGLEFAMACDVRIAAEDARLGQPEINLGIIPGGGGTQRLTRLVGLGRALELMMLGDQLTAVDAMRYGLVNMVVPPATLEAEARLVALRLAQKSQPALRAVKAAARAAVEVPLQRGLELEAAEFAALFATEEAREGIRRFLRRGLEA